MPIKSQKLTKGLLSMGEAGSPQEWGGQVRAVSLAAEYDEEDPIPVLSGEQLDGDETKTETLSGTVLDDFSAVGSIWVWCKQNEGDIVPFIWEPNSTDGTLRITGSIRVRQISLGGDVNTRTENDFEFKIIGETAHTPIA